MVLGLLVHLTPLIFFSRILWSEALVYKSYFFQKSRLRKLLDIRFSYKHCNFSRVCLLVKMASKTVIRSICHGLIIIFKSQTTPVLIENIFLKLRYSWIYSLCAHHSENPYLWITSFNGQIYFICHFKLKWDRILWCILTLSFCIASYDRVICGFNFEMRGCSMFLPFKWNHFGRNVVWY